MIIESDKQLHCEDERIRSERRYDTGLHKVYRGTEEVTSFYMVSEDHVFVDTMTIAWIVEF